MTGAELAKAEAALRFLTQGRTHEAWEKLAALVAESGGAVPRIPVVETTAPAVDRATA